MGICQSDRNLIDHIDQHQDDKPEPAESTTTSTVVSTPGPNENKLKDESAIMNKPPTMLMGRASIQSTSTSISTITNHTNTATNNNSKPASSSTSSFSFLGLRKKQTSAASTESSRARRKESLQHKINILTFASQKIDQYKTENEDLKCENAELNDINSELKEYIEDKNDLLMQQEQELKDMEAKMMRLEQEVFEKKAGQSRSINDILYKIQGDTVSKLKYTKMSAKRVIFIAGMNDLFYYDETSAESAAKCIVVRDIVVCHDQIASILPVNKAWFLIIGAKRKALFIAESMTRRDKWLYFIQNSLNNSLGASNSNMNLLNVHHLTQSMSTINSDYLSIPRGARAHHHHHHMIHSHIPNIVTSPRSGNTKIYIESEEFEYKALCIDYPRAVSNCGIVNNGHTVQINIDESALCRLSVSDDASMYRLKQFHFHTPSEHTIYSKQYEMELHLVHVNEEDESEILVLCFIFTTQQKYTAPQLVLNDSKTHLILPPQAQVNEETDDDESMDGIECDIDRNDFLDQFWHQMPPNKTKEEIPLNSPLNFDFLFKTASDNFIKNIKTNDINMNMQIYDYVGSLRTPPYTQGVKWLISKKTHFINNKQLNTLKKIWYHYL
eukprot:295121_1